jgi:CDP-diacylglycerol--glycerol-3-phosphate 3-phosphatidyltransferase
MTTSVMVSYTRARAESLIGSCKVGFMERPERIVLVIIGALFNRMAPVLWVIAVLSTITVIHRIRYTYLQTRVKDAEAIEARALVTSENSMPRVFPGAEVSKNI